MGTSDPDNKPYTAEVIKSLSPNTVLDVGAGAGVYLDIIRRDLDDNVHVTAIEAWKPYIEEFNLASRYNVVINEDVRNINSFDYDLVIFGDVLEHMSEEDALAVWDKVQETAKAAIISIPIIHYHQDAINGNPFEVHVEEDWDAQRVLNTFNGIKEYKLFPVTGVFLAVFDGNS